MSRFLEIRNLLGMTQIEMAEVLGCVQSNVSFLDRGQTITPEVASRLVDAARALGLGLTFDHIYATGQPLRLHEAVARAITANASLAMEFVTGWSLTDDFNLANLEDLEDRFGDTLDRLIKAYDKAVYQGQLGN
jgi:transcriptional regulator with XRE-family HTH domain